MSTAIGQTTSRLSPSRPFIWGTTNTSSWATIAACPMTAARSARFREARSTLASSSTSGRCIVSVHRATTKTPSRPACSAADLETSFWSCSEQASHNGELVHAVEAGALDRDDVAQLGDVLTGTAGGRQSVRDITMFDSTGLAIQDLGIALAAMERANELDLQTLDL